MNDFYNLIGKIKSKPGLYIGSPSVSSLFMFLNGYRFARRQLDIEPSAQEREFQEFQLWLQEKFAIKSSHSWSQLILFHSTDERDAFERFFVLLEEFLQQSSASVEKHPENVFEPA